MSGKRWISPWWWALLATLIIGADWWTGPYINFPILFLFPVTLAAWFNGRRWALGFALVLPLTRFLFSEETTPPIPFESALANASVDMAVLLAFAALVDRNARLTQRLEREVETLRGLLPICAYCKKVRVSDEEWVPLEHYVAAHSAASFSHGLCQHCLELHFAEAADGERGA